NAFYRGAPGKIYVATNYATFKRTSDGGVTWDTINGKGTDWISSSFWFDDSVGFIAGKNNRIAKTTDGGEDWEAYDFGSPQNYTYIPEDICFVNADVGWLCGVTKHVVKGFILKSTDGGRSWVGQPTPQDRPLVIRFYDSDHGWVSDGSTVHYTRDGGSTWELCNAPAGAVDLVAIGAYKAWAVCGSNYLLRTGDGLNWTYVNPGVPGSFGRIEFPDAVHGYAAGTKLIATDDGGVNWREVAGAPVMPFYDLMSFADKDRGIIGDYEAKHLYRTDDGGVSFVSIIENVDFEAENVIGERRGDVAPDEIVIIGGHFDSATDNHPCPSPGAEDNASGTACAMAAARAFKSLPFKRTVRYIAFGGEEDGLLGSRAYAEYCASKGEIIIAMLNADMVCYDEDFGTRDDYSVGRGNYKWLFDYLEGVGGLYGNRLNYDDFGGVSDDQSFRNVGYAAIGAIEGGKGPGGIMEYPYYHTTEDTLDKLHPALGVRFVRDYAAMFAHLAGISDVGVNDPRKPGAAAVPFTRPFAVYPNPYCYATSTGGVNFVGIRAPATVEIYDLAGRRVAREQVAVGCDECVWRPATPEGEVLAPGFYIYRVEGRDQKKAGKVVVVK
ncbi:MAG: M28 family peptidase, partial [candidate division Zixibacteria bacterium]|nr:M28 family peptidase [candidate division Zixibacteria bacterium]